MTETQAGVRRYRTIIQVTGIEELEPGKQVVNVIIPGWSADTEISFPVELFPEEIRQKIQPDVAFLAKVNLGAERLTELDPIDFELAPEPIPEEELFS